MVDYTLPDMDAYEFVSSIKDKARVVMMGGTYNSFDAEKALASGAVSTIMKPFKTADFFAAMDSAMTAEIGTASSVSMDIPVMEEAASIPPVSAPEMPSVNSISSEIPSVGQKLSAPAMPPIAPMSAGSMHPIPPIGASSMAPPVAPIGASSMAPSVAPIGASSMAPPVAPISAHTTHGLEGGVPPISSHATPLGTKSSSGIQPAVAPRRFNFPGSNSAIIDPKKVEDNGTPAAKVDSVVAPIPSTPVSSEVASVSRSFDRSTPKTPVPSISPIAQQAQAMAASSQAPTPEPAAQNVQIDPAVLRAEVIAAVKSMLPAIVNSYLKKLIQAEVKPQLQHWVDARVEALVKKMMQP